MILTRKEFFQTTLGLAIAGAFAPSCGDDEPATTGGESTSGSSSSSGSGSSSSSGSGSSSSSGSSSGSSSSSSSSGAGGAGGTSGAGGAGGAGGAPAPNCLANGSNTVIALNHGHTMTVSKADIMAGVDKVYDITGGSLHMHSVTLTAADFAMLANNMPVTATSTAGNMHTHMITVTCLP